MVTAINEGRSMEYAYNLIGAAGAVTTDEFATLAGLTNGRAHRWLHTQAQAGYLHRDEAGAYRTSCPWPRAGF